MWSQMAVGDQSSHPCSERKMEKSGSNVPAKIGMVLQTKKQRMDIGGLPDL